jgi:hypothetical protein
LEIEVEYHKQKTLEWRLVKGGVASNISRYPDVYVKLQGNNIMAIDAKCMLYDDLPDEDEPAIMSGPRRDIVHQMLVYLDYGGRCKYGAVLFADNRDRQDIVMEQEDRRIIFLNCYPFHRSAVAAFALVKQLIGA